MIYDVVIIGWWAAGLFTGINLDKKLKKVVLEKNPKPGVKVLLSGWERANVSNMDIEPMRDYFTQNKKFLLSIFSKYTNWDIMSFFAENNVNIVEEDRSRLILESGDSKELLTCLLDRLRENDCDLVCNSDVIEIVPNLTMTPPNPLNEGEQENSLPPHWEGIKRGVFTVTTRDGKKYRAKKVVLSSGWKSFAQVGTTWEWYNIAEKLGLNMVTPYRTLSGMATKRDLSEISWVSTVVDMELKDNPLAPSLAGGGTWKKSIYKEKGPILFTHFWVSGPIIHNVSNAIWEYLNNKGIKETDFESYILQNLHLELTFDVDNSPKRIVKFFELWDQNIQVNIELQNWRSWKEAKATGGWISTNELDNNMQSKKYPWLYIIGEVVDVTGKTWGFNLQWAWSSWYVAAQSINNTLDIS